MTKAATDLATEVLSLIRDGQVEATALDLVRLNRLATLVQRMARGEIGGEHAWVLTKLVDGRRLWGEPRDAEWDWTPVLRHAALFESYDDAVDAIDGNGDPAAAVAFVEIIVRKSAPAEESREDLNVH